MRVAFVLQMRPLFEGRLSGGENVGVCAIVAAVPCPPCLSFLLVIVAAHSHVQRFRVHGWMLGFAVSASK